MSIHIAAQQGEIADKILLPGDPLRAKFIAENFLEDAVCFNEVRNMFGYTGTYKGHRVSVMGTGMGMPSISIYARELIVDYGVKKLIRVGTAGSLNEDVRTDHLLEGIQQCIDQNDFSQSDQLLVEGNALKSDISAIRHSLLERIQNDESSLKIALLYLSTLQETQEIISNARHLLRAAKRFCA